MQLINSAVYDQQAIARAKAMEATRQEKLRRKSERQQLKLKRFLERSKSTIPSAYGASFGTVAATSSSYEVNVGGIRYHVSAGGNKLVKISGEIYGSLDKVYRKNSTDEYLFHGLDDAISATATPKKAVVGGVTFIRSKSGNLWRSGLVKAKW